MLDSGGRAGRQVSSIEGVALDSERVLCDSSDGQKPEKNETKDDEHHSRACLGTGRMGTSHP